MPEYTRQVTVFANDDEVAPPDPYARARPWEVSIAVSAAVFLGLGALAGWVWSWVAVPPDYMVYRPDYAYYASEAEFSRVFDMDLAFAVIGAVAALIGGVVVGWFCWRHGWAVTVLAGLGALGAAVIAWRLGVVLGPPSLADSTETASRGDVFTGPVDVGTRSILLVWPIAALVGVIIAVWLCAPREEPGYGQFTRQWNPDAETGVKDA